ncbi:MAG TPA: Flp pilus assembly protein CpaB [Nocardioidaceae bacterium]|nr:Flp pilus assembly protein CpaB [Nocardioidaceae bacterium]
MEGPRTLSRSVRLRRRRLRRALLARRRPLGAVLAAVAALVGLQAMAPQEAPTTNVLTAARDLPGGKVVDRADLTWTDFAPDTAPEAALDSVAEAVGRTTTGPVRAGEPITDVRLVSGSLLDGYPGRVAAPVRIGDAGAVGLLRIGDRVDVIAADPPAAREAVVVASGAPVVALPRAGETALASGGLVVLAVTDDTARALAAASVSAYLSVVLTR